MYVFKKSVYMTLVLFYNYLQISVTFSPNILSPYKVVWSLYSSGFNPFGGAEPQENIPVAQGTPVHVSA